jgi:hypothetical protein
MKKEISFSPKIPPFLKSLKRMKIERERKNIPIKYLFIPSGSLEIKRKGERRIFLEKEKRKFKIFFLFFLFFLFIFETRSHWYQFANDYVFFQPSQIIFFCRKR